MKISLRYDKEKAIQEPIVKVRCGPQKTVSKHLKHENYWNHQNKETPPPPKKKGCTARWNKNLVFVSKSRTYTLFL